MPEVLALPHRVPSLGRAVEQFLAAKPLSANGRRSYSHTLGTVVGDLGADLPLDAFTAERVRRVLEDRWGDALASTWNNRLTAVGSFRRWAQAQGWVTEDPLAGIERRPQVRDDTAPVRYEQLHTLWTRPDVHVREKTLWRMLYETAARAIEILALNVENLDVGARRAVVRGKGGHRQEVVWASGTARLLPRHLGGRPPERRCVAPVDNQSHHPMLRLSHLRSQQSERGRSPWLSASAVVRALPLLLRVHTCRGDRGFCEWGMHTRFARGVSSGCATPTN